MCKLDRERVPTLIYLAHLRWDHVWQRPQQLMTRFAERCPVIYVDPPDDVRGSEAHLEFDTGPNGLSLVRPIFPSPIPEPYVANYEQLWLQLLPEVLALGSEDPILWVSSPHADYLVKTARPQLTIYDCMDDLASFRGATKDIRLREERLIALSDLVFTGGYSMYEARRNAHPAVYCFPSGVDADHYRETRDPGLAVPQVLEQMSPPRLGYFGVLDERIDWRLIGEVAAARPEWNWALVGRTAKVKPHELPKAPNIHYLGKQEYEDLPAFLKGLDVATMPFMLDQSTRYISPTKTLEYLAGGKPVLSTPVPDVEAFYSDTVSLATGTSEWIAAIEQILAESPDGAVARQQRGDHKVFANSWDNIVGRMWTLIEVSMRSRSANRARGRLVLDS